MSLPIQNKVNYPATHCTTRAASQIFFPAYHRRIKTVFILICLAILGGLTAGAQVISWHDSHNNTIPAAGLAGVIAATNWNVSDPGNNASVTSLHDSSNNVTTAGFTIGGTFGGWQIKTVSGADTDGTYNERMLAGYANTANSASGSPEHLAITGIPYPLYTIIAYFSSDTTNRLGTTTCAGTRYYFATLGQYAVTNPTAVFLQTTDTTGANPAADYAVFTNLSGASQTLVLSVTNGGGLAGFQILRQTNLALALSSDTSATPSTNVYVGSTVTLSALFSGTPVITNQWEVNTGSGFVAIPGATNATLTLTNLQLADSGSYALYASNPAGSSNSTPLALNVVAFPTNNLGINVQFTGSWIGSGNAPTQTGSAVIGNGGDVWNTVSNPTGGTSPAGLARGTNLVLFDTAQITTPVTMDYVGDYIFNGTAFGFSNPFASVASPYAPLMSGYMGSVTTSGADTNTITVRHLVPGVYDLYLYVCGRSDGQTRVDDLFANDQSAVCGPNNGSYTLTPGVNFVHLTPTVNSNGILNISYYGTTDAGQALLNGFQLNGPDTNVSLTLSSDTSCDSPLNDYAGRKVSFTAAFAGFPTPSLQWEVSNGSGFTPIPGATNSTLTLASVQTTDSGSYALFATNAAGGLNSTALALNVQPLPSPLAIDLQFDGTTYTGTHATPQSGPAAIGNGGDFWNPISNPNPVGADTNPISGTGLVLSDVNSYGTPLTVDYTASQDYNFGGGTPFNGSGSPAADLMQASLVILNGNTGTATVHGLSAGVYDLYLYSSSGNNQQKVVTRFGANDAYDTCGPNNTNNTLILETNYVHLTPTVTSNGLLKITFSGRASGQGNLNGVQLSGPGATQSAPVANFAGAPRSIYLTQPVVFTDYSSGNITNWSWNFGDGNVLNTNSSGAFSYTYAATGTYTVSLSVSGPVGAVTNTQTGYIVVSGGPAIGSTTLSGGSLILSGTGGIAGNSYRILSATNLALPMAAWVPVWTNVFAPDGSYSYTNSQPNNAANFFRLVTP